MRTTISIFLILLVCFTIMVFSAKLLTTVNSSYHTGMMRLPNGEVLEVKVKRWNEIEKKLIVVTSEDGKTYLVYPANIILKKDATDKEKSK